MGKQRNKKIRILHVVESLGGGVYTYFVNLSKVLGEDDLLETFIIYSDKRKEIDAKTVSEDIPSNIHTTVIKMQEKILPLADLSTVLKLVKSIRAINPDIIHLHSSKAGVLGRVAAKFSFSKALIYYSPHGYSFLRLDVSAKKRQFFWQIEKLISKFFGGTTIACGDTEKEYAEKFGRVRLIRNGVNIDKVRIFKKPTNNNKLTVGTLGRITYARNPSLFNTLANKNPEIQFVWIGDGELRNALKALNIKITEWFKDQSEGLKWLNTMDVYIQTSLWEGLPIAVLEAMAMGKPVLATNVIGNKDAVLHGETGYLFNTEEEFQKYLDKLKNAETRKIFGLAGLERCKNLFDCNKNFQELINFYKTELEENDEQK